MCGIVLYYIGQYNQLPNKFLSHWFTIYFLRKGLVKFKPTASQKATFKFFLRCHHFIFIQVLSGLVTINDFIDWLGYLGIQIKQSVPVTLPRSWHLMLALYWISTCWIVSSIFILPILSKRSCRAKETSQFVVCFIIYSCRWFTLGIVMGPLGLMGNWWYWLGHQGWEFVDFGKVYQLLLMVIFALWFCSIPGYKTSFDQRPELEFTQLDFILSNWHSTFIFKWFYSKTRNQFCNC